MLTSCDFIAAIKHYEQEDISERINKFSYRMLTLTKIAKSTQGKAVRILFLFERH